MNTKILFLLIFLLVPLCSAANPVININYTSDTIVDSDVDSQDTLVKITTLSESSCKYDVFQNVDYEDMIWSFDVTNGKIHKKTFQGLSDGSHKYYLKCLNETSVEPKEITLTINVNSLISAKIELSEDAPLQSGRIEVELTTSKVPRSTPELKYSLGGDDILEVVLEGSGTEWNGYLLLSESLGESILSFNFRAEDLEGRMGNELTSGRVFEVDTVEPLEILEFKAIPDEEGIELFWHIEEEINKINIYRSTSQEVGYMSFYESTSGSSYLDKDIESGTTYYYRISAVDSAGNEGDLSEERYSSTSGQSSSTASALSPVLVNEVTNFLTQLSSLRQSISESSVMASENTDQETTMLSILGLDKKPATLLAEIDSIKTTAEGYKAQDMSRETLTARLDSLDMRLKVIQKEFPVGITIVEEYDEENPIDEDLIRETLYKYDQSLSEEINDNSIDATMDLIEQESLKITSWYGLIQINYYDASKSEFSVVKRTLQSTLEMAEGSFFLEVLPGELYESLDEIEVQNRNAQKLTSKEMISFDSSTKSITYYIPGNELQSAQNIKPVFIKIANEAPPSKGITGYFAFGSSSAGGSLMMIFGVVSLVLLAYFLVLKRQNVSETYPHVSNGLNNMMGAIKKDDLESAKEHYKTLQKNYSTLDDKEKKKIYSKLESAKTKILITEFEKDLAELNKTKDKDLLLSIEKKIERFPENVRTKINPIFTKIKNEIDKQ